MSCVAANSTIKTGAVVDLHFGAMGGERHPPLPSEKRRATAKPTARCNHSAQHPESKPASGLEDLHVYRALDC